MTKPMTAGALLAKLRTAMGDTGATCYHADYVVFCDDCAKRAIAAFAEAQRRGPECTRSKYHIRDCIVCYAVYKQGQLEAAQHERAAQPQPSADAEALVAELLGFVVGWEVCDKDSMLAAIASYTEAVERRARDETEDTARAWFNRMENRLRRKVWAEARRVHREIWFENGGCRSDCSECREFRRKAGEGE